MQSNDDLVLVVDRTALIENLLNQVVEAFFRPRKEASMFFWDVLLDSSILPLGSKVKIALAISQELKTTLENDALHRVVSLRNAFAHHATNSHPVLTVGVTSEDDQSHYTLQIISNSGKITKKRRGDALADFNAAYESAKKSLLALLASIRELQRPNASP
ncbi:MAG: hypothetical protein ACR2H4_15550 [Pyrinomonadaceae bacterium]